MNGEVCRTVGDGTPCLLFVKRSFPRRGIQQRVLVSAYIAETRHLRAAALWGLEVCVQKSVVHFSCKPL